MNVTRQVQDLADAISDARPELDASDQAIAIALYRLLAAGRPVSPSEVAAASGQTLGRVDLALDAWPAVFRDGDGRVVGFWGLTVAEMPPHEIFANGVRLWAWCAWDTLFLPELLDATVQVKSVAPGGEEPIELQVSPERLESVVPSDVVVSFLTPVRPFDDEVITTFCHFVHFFPSRARGEEWVATHPGTFLPSLTEAFELARLSNRRFANQLREASGT